MSDVYFAAFDTSNYTTSFAVCNGEGKIVLNCKKLLNVSEGQRGLRQSDAVFQHTAAMSFVSSRISDFRREHPDAGFAAVGASARPRDIAGSYMPCFLVGRSEASVCASILNAPFYEFSHQAGHIMAALYSSESLDYLQKPFAAFHVSGGTTDILLSEGFSDGVFKVERIGGTKDLNAGQVIDRIGVLMGLPFPSGVHLERLALENELKVPKFRSKVTGLECNLSGLENKAAELYKKTEDKRLTSAFVLNSIADVLSNLSENLLREKGDIPIVYAGGVMSCSLIKEKLEQYSKRFAAPEFSSDNAAGCALLTRLAYINSQRKTEEI